MRYISEAAERIDEQLDAGEDGKKKKTLHSQLHIIVSYVLNCQVLLLD